MTCSEEVRVADLRFGFAPLPPAAPGFDPAGDARALILPGTPSPARAPIPGTQCTGSYARDERFVIRVPDAWNGNLVVIGTPAFRSEFANDAIWGDALLARGYATASSNKGIPYGVIIEPIASTPAPRFAFPFDVDRLGLASARLCIRFGTLTPQKKPVDEWNDDLVALTGTAKAYLADRRRSPRRTYAVGLSNGGAQVRSLLERHPELVDGGVEWAGVYWSPERSLLDYLPRFIAAIEPYTASAFRDGAAASAIEAAGYPRDIRTADPSHPSLWFEHYTGQPSFYADVTLFAFALLLDPHASSSLAPLAGLAERTGRASYVPSPEARASISSFAHSGAIEKPLISIAGTADMFITPANNATPYLEAVRRAGRGSLYAQYLVAGGTHVDTFADPAWGYGLQPQAPFAWRAFDQLVAVVEHGARLHGSRALHLVRRPADIR